MKVIFFLQKEVRFSPWKLSGDICHVASRSISDRSTVISLRKQGLDIGEICRRTNWDRRFVRRWVLAADSGKGPQDQPRPGRPGKLSQRILRGLRSQIKGKRNRSLRKTTSRIRQKFGVQVSKDTVQRAGIFRPVVNTCHFL